MAEREGKDDLTSWLVLVAQTVGAVGAGSAATVVTGGDPFAGLAAGATGQAALQAAVERIVQRKRAKTERMVEYAASTARRDVNELLEAILEDDALLELLAVAVEAAMHALSERKLRTIGNALGSGALAGDDAQLDVELLVTKAVSDLEAPHFRVLLFMVRRGAASITDLKDSDALQPLRVGMESLLATLRTHGLVDAATPTTGPPPSSSDYGIGSGWSIPSSDQLYVTTFGRLVLQRYSDAGDDSESGRWDT